MKWPWVSRRSFNRLEAEARRLAIALDMERADIGHEERIRRNLVASAQRVLQSFEGLSSPVSSFKHAVSQEALLEQLLETLR